MKKQWAHKKKRGMLVVFFHCDQKKEKYGPFLNCFFNYFLFYKKLFDYLFLKIIFKT